MPSKKFRQVLEDEMGFDANMIMSKEPVVSLKKLIGEEGGPVDLADDPRPPKLLYDGSAQSGKPPPDALQARNRSGTEQMQMPGVDASPDTPQITDDRSDGRAPVTDANEGGQKPSGGKGTSKPLRNNDGYDFNTLVQMQQEQPAPTRSMKPAAAGPQVTHGDEQSIAEDGDRESNSEKDYSANLLANLEGMNSSQQ